MLKSVKTPRCSGETKQIQTNRTHKCSKSATRKQHSQESGDGSICLAWKFSLPRLESMGFWKIMDTSKNILGCLIVNGSDAEKLTTSSCHEPPRFSGQILIFRNLQGWAAASLNSWNPTDFELLVPSAACHFLLGPPFQESEVSHKTTKVTKVLLERKEDQKKIFIHVTCVDCWWLLDCHWLPSLKAARHGAPMAKVAQLRRIWSCDLIKAKLQNSKTAEHSTGLSFLSNLLKVAISGNSIPKNWDEPNSWAPGPFTTVTVRRVLIEMCISFVIQCHLAAMRSQFRFGKHISVLQNEVNLLCFENTLVTELYGLRGWDMGIWWCLVKRVV